MTMSLFITRAMLFLFIGMIAAVCVGADTAKTLSSLDAEPIPLKPDFTAVVVKDAGLWPQLQITDEGTLLAFGYNAPAHTTLPADVECWASDDCGQTWIQRGIAAPRPAPDANYYHWASGFGAKDELLVIPSGMDDATNARGQRAPNDVRMFRSTDRRWQVLVVRG